MQRIHSVKEEDDARDKTADQDRPDEEMEDRVELGMIRQSLGRFLAHSLAPSTRTEGSPVSSVIRERMSLPIQ
jgi:hypothetical protein